MGVQIRTAVNAGPDLFAHSFVGDPVDRTFLNTRMHQKRSLDLTAADVFTAANDQILDTVDDEQKPFLIEVGHITGAKPVA